MRNPFRAFLGWYHRLGIREQVVAQVVGAIIIVVGTLMVAILNGWFTLTAARVVASSQQTRKTEAPPAITTQDSKIQDGSGNLQAGRDIVVQGDLILGGRDGSVQGESNSFIPLAEPLRQMVQSNLLAVQQAYAGVQVHIEIAAQVGDPERMKLADELAEIFRSAGFNAKVLSSSILTQERAPMLFIMHPDGRAYAMAIGQAFGPMLRVQVPLPLQGSESRPRDELHISVLGKPVFLPNGVAVFN